MTAKMEANCRLMQDFNAVRPVDATNDLRAIRIQNRPLVFSIGSDDVLYLIYQDDDQPTQGWTRRALLGVGANETVTAFGVAQDPTHTDRFRIAAAFTGSDGRNVLKVSRLVDFDAVNWGSDAAVAVLWTSVRLPDARAIGNEVCIDHAGTVLLATTKPPSPAKYYLYDPNTLKLSEYGLPEAGAKIISLALGSVWGERGVFLLYDVGTEARTLLFQSFVDPQFGTTFKQRFDIDGQVHDFFVVPDANGYDSVYTCGDSVHHFSDPTTRATIASGKGTVYTQIRAVQEDKKVTLWLRGTAGTSAGLYYITNQFSAGGLTTITKWTAPLLMMSDVGQFACERETYISNHLFAVSSQNTLAHLYQDSETTLWRQEPIYLEDTAEAEEISAYVVTARFDDLPVGQKNRVKVSATSSIYAAVNESSVLIGPRKSVWVDLGEDPEISVSIPVEDLAVPNVVFTADFLPQGSAEVDCTEKVLEDLGKYKTGTDLKNAKAEDGSAVFPDRSKLPSDQTLDSVAATTQKILQHAKSMKTTKEASRSFQSPAADSDGSHSSLSLSIKDGEASLTTTQARSGPAQRSSRGLFDGIGNAIGDVLHAFGKGLLAIANFVVDPSSGILKVVMQLASGAVSFFVKTFEQVVGLLKPLLELAKVGWEALKKLVAFFFNFGDILKTKELLKYFCNESFEALKKNVRYLKTKMNLYADEAKTQLGASELNDQITKAVGDTTLNDQKTAAKQLDGAGGKERKTSEANWMNRKVRQSAKTSADGTGSAEGEEDSLVSSLVKVFTDAWEDLKFLGSRLEDLIGKLVNGKISIASFLIEMLKAAGAVLIDTAQNVGNVILDLFDKIIELVRTILNQKFKIPVISSLFNKFLGVKLEFSLLDVIAFIGAVPTTIIYKLVTGRAPHQDISKSSLSEAFGSASPSGSEATTASRSLPTAMLASANRTNGSTTAASVQSRSISSRSVNRAVGAIGIVGGALGLIRGVTLFLKLAMLDDAPRFLKFVDLGLALLVVTFGLARLGLTPKGGARDIAIILGTFAAVVFIYNLFELKYMLETKGWPGNTVLTILGVLALIRWGFFVSATKNAKVISLTLFAALNWFLAAPHHIIKESPAPPIYLITAGLRGAFVVTLSGLLIDISS